MTNNTHIARSGSGYFSNAPEVRLGQQKSFYGVTLVCWAFHTEKPLYFILFHILIKFKGFFYERVSRDFWSVYHIMNLVAPDMLYPE